MCERPWLYFKRNNPSAKLVTNQNSNDDIHIKRESRQRPINTFDQGKDLGAKESKTHKMQDLPVLFYPTVTKVYKMILDDPFPVPKILKSTINNKVIQATFCNQFTERNTLT